jgi:hypothetical protein
MLGKLELTDAEKKVLVMDDLDDDNGTSQSSAVCQVHQFQRSGLFASLHFTILFHCFCAVRSWQQGFRIGRFSQPKRTVGVMS